MLEIKDIDYTDNTEINYGEKKPNFRLPNYEARVIAKVSGREVKADARHEGDKESAAVYAIEGIVRDCFGIDIRAGTRNGDWKIDNREENGEAIVNLTRILRNHDSSHVNTRVFSGRAPYERKDWNAYVFAYVNALNEMLRSRQS